MKNKVSIVTATYNSSKYIEETYESIRNQSFSDWEWLVTDDASTDDTFEKLENICKSNDRVRAFRNAINSGAAVSRNNSLEYASGEFIAFIDADDTWHPSKLTQQIKFMTDNSLDFSFTAYTLIDEDGNHLDKSVDSKNTGFFNYRDMLAKKATLGCSTVILSRKALGELRMPNIRTGQDYAFWLMILKRGFVAYIFPSKLTNYRISQNAISRNKFKKALRQWEIYRRIEGLGAFISLYYFVFYAIRALFRKE
ncbi:glycosyltransferase [Aeromonas caviae]|uniref:glycosyltransferase family 2 protein n=1 Tax=Aeromonas caviae TaxID=648 RepID=UPI002447F2B9|nr:glycosyltransferase [Aeromonas caviae]MDH1841620.1 glycosyltransferase [Aeromonas caviae]